MKKLVSIKSLLLIIALSFIFVACEEGIDKNKVSAEKDDIQYQLETTAHKIDRKINDLQAELDTASTEASVTIRSQVAELEKLKRKTNDKLEDLSNTTAEEWKDFKSGVDSFIDDLKNDLEKITQEK